MLFLKIQYHTFGVFSRTIDGLKADSTRNSRATPVRLPPPSYGSSSTAFNISSRVEQSVRATRILTTEIHQHTWLNLINPHFNHTHTYFRGQSHTFATGLLLSFTSVPQKAYYTFLTHFSLLKPEQSISKWLTMHFCPSQTTKKGLGGIILSEYSLSFECKKKIQLVQWNIKILLSRVISRYKGLSGRKRHLNDITFNRN